MNARTGSSHIRDSGIFLVTLSGSRVASRPNDRVLPGGTARSSRTSTWPGLRRSLPAAHQKLDAVRGRMVGEQRQVEPFAQKIHDRNRDSEHDGKCLELGGRRQRRCRGPCPRRRRRCRWRCDGGVHDPNPRTLLRTWPTRKLNQQMKASRAVIDLRTPSYSGSWTFFQMYQ